MNKKEWQKLLLVILIVILFGLILLTVFQFTKNPEEVVIEEEPLHKDEIIFVNNSSMSEKDIRELLEVKRETIKNFIEHIEYYNISEVSNEYLEEDNAKYLVLTENFLNQLREMVTEEFYTFYWDQLLEIEPKKNINLPSRIYRAPIEIFDELYYRSSVANTFVNEETLILKNATDEKIEAWENIKLCETPSGLCTRDDKYNYILEKENEVWKIAKLI